MPSSSGSAGPGRPSDAEERPILARAARGLVDRRGALPATAAETAEAADPPLAEVLERLGAADLRPGQDRAIAAALGGQDALVVMATGSGKSLCYQAPALCRPGLTLVDQPAHRPHGGPGGAPAGGGAAGRGAHLAGRRGGVARHPGRPARRSRAAGCSARRSASTAPTSGPPSPAAGSSCWPSTRRTASPSGGTTSGRTTAAWRGGTPSAPAPPWRSPPRPRRPCRPTSCATSGCATRSGW